MRFAVIRSSSCLVRTWLLPAILAAGLLAACNFPGKDGQTVSGRGLWIANGTNVVEYNPAQLNSGATPPHVSINSAVFGTPQGVVFDRDGNLWVLDPAGLVNGIATPALFKFSAAQLAALRTDNAPDPVATITSTLLSTPQQGVFDVSGNVWITDHNTNTVLVFTGLQLAQTGTNKFAPVVAMTSPQFSGPSGITFDSSGDLWIANNGIAASAAQAFGGGTTIVELTAASLPAVAPSGTATPSVPADVTLSDEAKASIQSPWGLAFDSAGNLWSSNSATSTLVKFARADLMTGAPVPAVTLSSTKVNNTPSLNQPHGLCMDDVGNVVAINEAGGSDAAGIAFYGVGQLATGSPAPGTFIAGKGTMLNEPEGCAFGPVVP
jgi:secreted PhoX family phosphatase